MRVRFLAVSAAAIAALAIVIALAPIGDAVGLRCHATAQTAETSTYRTISAEARFCSFLGYTDVFEKRLPMVVSTEGDITSVEPLVERIVTYSGVEANINVYSGRALNAAAVLDARGPGDFERFIIYHPVFFSFLNRRFRAESEAGDWAAIGVLAHEVGHHLAEHTLEAANQRYFELQADWYSGYILGKMGADLDSAQSVLKTFWPARRSKTHPDNAQRLAALSDGWRQSSCEVGGDGCLEDRRVFEPPPPPEAASGDQPAPKELEFICTLGGEQLFVVKGERSVHWMRHYRRRLTPIGELFRRAEDPACAWRLEIAMTEGRAMTLCGEAEPGSGKLRFSGEPISPLIDASATSSSSAATRGIEGLCLPCGDARAGLCPGSL